MDDHVYVKYKSCLFEAYLEIRQVFCLRLYNTILSKHFHIYQEKHFKLNHFKFLTEHIFHYTLLKISWINKDVKILALP